MFRLCEVHEAAPLHAGWWLIQSGIGLVSFIADLRNARARELEEKRINKELANIRWVHAIEPEEDTEC